MKRVADPEVIERLKKLMTLDSRGAAMDQHKLGLGQLESPFPGGVFPRAAMHEVISSSSEEATCSSGFMSVILSRLLGQNGLCLWISLRPRRSIFPPALLDFSLDASRIIFVDADRPKDALWVLEEALKCAAISAVVGEISELSFAESRRFQLAVERSQVTGFIHRFQPKVINATACVSRWQIKPMASSSEGALPGPGFPQWQVNLLKVTNGQPGQWRVQWSPQGLEYILPETEIQSQDYELQIG